MFTIIVPVAAGSEFCAIFLIDEQPATVRTWFSFTSSKHIYFTKQSKTLNDNDKQLACTITMYAHTVTKDRGT